MEATGVHSHKCSSCGNVWCHAESNADNVEAHKCSSCGQYQFWKYVAKGYRIPVLYQLLDRNKVVQTYVEGYGDNPPDCFQSRRPL